MKKVFKVKRTPEDDLSLLGNNKYMTYRYTKEAFSNAMSAPRIKDALPLNLFPIVLDEIYDNSIYPIVTYESLFTTDLSDIIGTLLSWNDEYYEIELCVNLLKSLGYDAENISEIKAILHYIPYPTHNVEDYTVTFDSILAIRIAIQIK